MKTKSFFIQPKSEKPTVYLGKDKASVAKYLGINLIALKQVKISKSQHYVDIENLKQQKIDLDNAIIQCFRYRNPTRKFDVAELVTILNSEQTYSVVWSYADTKVYLLKNINTEEVIVSPWHEIFKKPKSKKRIKFFKSFRKAPNFQASKISDLITRYYTNDINMNPEYQVEFSWGKSKKEDFLESILINRAISIGNFSFMHIFEKDEVQLEEIIDGKERLKTIIDFYEGKITFHEMFFSDLNQLDQEMFLTQACNIGTLPEAIEEEAVIDLFISMNTNSSSVSKSALKHLRREYL